MNALFGALSDIAVVVTHKVPSPGSGLLATHPGGNAGALTVSHVSRHGPAGVGVGLSAGVAVPTGVAVGVPPGVAEDPGVPDGPGVPPGVGVVTGTPLASKSYASTR